jgi:tetratricopeptide (TPR) repeat protein
MLAAMHGLATTLRSQLDHADVLFAAGRIPAARQAYEDLLEKSQERTDRGMEVIARSMLARCLLRRKDVDGARNELDQAERGLDGGTSEAVARYRAARARLAIAGDDPTPELRDYLEWAELAESWDEAIDACFLLAEDASRGTRPADDRVAWLQRAVELSVEHDIEPRLGPAHAELAGALETAARPAEALDAWQQALQYYNKRGTRRQVVSAAWAVGTLAVRDEDWPLAQSRLEQAIAGAVGTDDCVDLLALALSDLARIHEAAGDVIEARRTMIRALAMAREQDLPKLWPERWDALREFAKRLELEP